jgi:hypothetical protein
MIKIFRSLVVFNLATYIGFLFAPYYWAALYGPDSDIMQALSWTGVGAVYEGSQAIFYMSLAAYIVVSVGLVALKSWAKYLFYCLMALEFVLTPLSGVAVLPPPESLAFQAMTFIDGFVLCMLLFTGVGGAFDSHNQSLTATPQSGAS